MAATKTKKPTGLSSAAANSPWARSFGTQQGQPQPQQPLAQLAPAQQPQQPQFDPMAFAQQQNAIATELAGLRTGLQRDVAFGRHLGIGGGAMTPDNPTGNTVSPFAPVGGKYGDNPFNRTNEQRQAMQNDFSSVAGQPWNPNIPARNDVNNPYFTGAMGPGQQMPGYQQQTPFGMSRLPVQGGGFELVGRGLNDQGQMSGGRTFGWSTGPQPLTQQEGLAGGRVFDETGDRTQQYQKAPMQNFPQLPQFPTAGNNFVADPSLFQGPARPKNEDFWFNPKPALITNMPKPSFNWSR